MPGLDHATAVKAKGTGREKGSEPEIAWAVGDAQALPLPDASADAYVIAFGIRVFQEYLAIADDRIQRRAELVAHRGHEIGFGRCRLPCRCVPE